MVLDALEIGVVVLMAIGVLVWGPEKVPEIAKTISNARKQLDGYTKQLSGLTKELQTSMNTGNFDNLGNVLTGAAAGPLSEGASPSPEEMAAAAANAQSGSPAPSVAPPAPGTSSLAPPVPKSGDELLLEMAKQLRITTQGKTRDEIQSEILARASSPAETHSTGSGTTASTSPAPVTPSPSTTSPFLEEAQADPKTPENPPASAAS